jgi:hypothetical protein
MKVTLFCICAFLALSFAQAGHAFTENFNDGNDRDWKPIQGKWSVKKQVYVQEDLPWTTTSTHETYNRSYFGEVDWTDYTFEAKVRIEKGGELAPIVGIFFRVTEKSPTGDYYYFRLDQRASEGPGLIKAPNVTMQINGLNPAKIGQDYVLKVEVKGKQIKCYVDGKLEIDIQDDDFRKGAIGVGTFNAEGHFDDVTVNGPGIPLAVSPREKLARTWGVIKAGY